MFDIEAKRLSPSEASAQAVNQRTPTARVPYLRQRIVRLLVIACLAFATHFANGGGGPENVLLLVNSNSEDSKTVANHYISLRKIPACNVLYLDVQGSLEEQGAGRYFRNSILLPALNTIDERRLGLQIDYVVYSSDFPWRIELKTAMPDATFTPPFDGNASITGLTYLAPIMAAQSPAVVMPNINWYVPEPHAPNQSACEKLDVVYTRAFQSQYLWDPTGKRTDDPKKGQRYLLSTMLAVTRGRGNSVAEVVNYLSRAVAADGTRPKGTIYFMTNGDVRSKTRDKCYPQVVAELNRRGIRASVVSGRIPSKAKDIAGLMTGTETFDLPASGNVILPGAICEHLTSSGGMLAAHGGQTPLSVFLRAGAAGASGTVIEPRAIQAKFPLPSLHVHYTRGCSLAESFYQSISGPYQLLIVGDPLCQPWAVRPQVTVAGIDPSKPVNGTIIVTPSGTAAAGQTLGSFELFVDGRQVTNRVVPNQGVRIDTTQLADGHHELRVVGIHAGAIETQGRQIIPFVVRNKVEPVVFEVSPRPGVSATGTLKVKVRHPGATSIAIRQNSREVGRVEGEAGEFEIQAATLGRGPTMLQAFSSGVESASAPATIQVN